MSTENTINLHELTGQESGVVLAADKSGLRRIMVLNWGANDGLPFLFDELAALDAADPFLYMQPDDVAVELGDVHEGRLRDEVALSGEPDVWNPNNDDLESDEPCVVYPLSNGWRVIAPENWN